MDRLSEIGGITKEQAATLTAEASFGGGWGKVVRVGASGRASWRGQTIEREAFNRMQDYAEQHQVMDLWSQVSDASRRYSSATGESELASLDESFGANLTRMRRFEDRASASFQTSEHWSAQASQVRAESQAIDRELGQPFFGWLAERPGADGRPIGVGGAMRLATPQTPEEAETLREYAAEFVSEQLPAPVAAGIASVPSRATYEDAREDLSETQVPATGAAYGGRPWLPGYWRSDRNVHLLRAGRKQVESIRRQRRGVGAVIGEGTNVTAILAFVVFVAASLIITWWAARRTHSAGEFYTAGSSITGLQNGLALAGDFMSAATFLGLIGLAFIGGADAMLFTVGVTVSWAFLLFTFADRLRNLGRFTFADIIAYRLRPDYLRIFAAIGTLTVAIPYLIAQMVGAGSLIETLFGLPYFVAVVIVGSLMTIYVVFGGMLATTWVQVIKAVMLLGGGTAMVLLALSQFGFDLNALFDRVAEVHPRGAGIFRPGGLYNDPISVLGIALAFVCGTAGLPHILMRFFTVPDAHTARQSIAYGVVIIGFFQAIIVVVGFAAIALLSGQAEYVDESGRVAGGGNMVSVYLSRHVGGEIFFGLISAVAFATILAVVAGILLSASAAVAHDLYARVVRGGEISDKSEVFVSRLATVVIGISAIGLSLLFRDMNVGILALLALAIAASVNFPAIFLALFWKDLTTRGAIAGGATGLIVVIALIVLSPTVWVNVLGNDSAIYPYDYPTLFSVSAAFIVTVVVSLADRSNRATTDRSGYETQVVRSELGV